ncbi:14950_t:CDS:2, partial [Funneliformis geosporum]
MSPIKNNKSKQHHSAISDDIKHQLLEAINANNSAQTFKHKEVKFPVLERAMRAYG